MERRDRAQDRISELERRLEDSREEQERIADSPETFLLQRRNLLSAIEEADAARRAASDARATGETTQAEADRAARMALEAMSAAREEKARSEAQLEAARRRRRMWSTRSPWNWRASRAHSPSSPESPARRRNCPPFPMSMPARKPEGASASGWAPSICAPRRSRRGRTQRDKLKPSAPTSPRRSASCARRIAEPEQAEGRERLLAAFEVIDGHFKDALHRPSSTAARPNCGWSSRDDPLEAGLEIFACPPGKQLADDDADVAAASRR